MSKVAGARSSGKELSPSAGDAVMAAFEALETSGAQFALIRGSATAADIGGDVDILVRPEDVDKAHETLLAGNWIEAPSAGHGSHRFFVMYHEESGRWYQLDLVNSIELGRLQGHRTGIAPACLARRIWRDGVPRLDPDDTFWLMFVYSAWKELTPTRRSQLSTYADEATTAGPAAAFVGDLLADNSSVLESVIRAARAGDWATVAKAQRNLVSRLRRQDHVRAIVTSAANWVRRRAWPANHPGLSVGLIGLDGAGKSTVVAALKSAVTWPTVSLYMGVWRTSRLDRIVAPLLGAQLALRLGRLSRIALLVRYHRALGRLVLLDRYVVDAKLPSPDLDWMGKLSAALVLRTAAPPDRTVFLDVPTDVAYARKGEQTIDELRRRRDYYVAMQQDHPQMVTVDADQPLDSVVAAVNRVLWAGLVHSNASTSKDG